MCKASLEHPDVRDANQGDKLIIATNGYGMGMAVQHPGAEVLGSVHIDDLLDSLTRACPSCIHTGAKLAVIGGLHPDIVAELGERPALVFIETHGSHRWIIHDMVVIDGRPDLPQIPLAAFAGCEVMLDLATARDQMTDEQAIGALADLIEVDADADPIDIFRRMLDGANAGDRTDEAVEAPEPVPA